MGRLIDEWRKKNELPPLEERVKIVPPKDHVVIPKKDTLWQKIKRLFK